MDRFNYLSDWKGNLITEEFAGKMPRAKYISFLLNSEDPRLTNPSDSSYRILCAEFIKFADNPKAQQTISLYKGQVKALAEVKIKYVEKDFLINMELIPEVLNDRSAKWAINRVEAACFTSVEDSLRKYFLAPNSHETSFINLNKLNSETNPLYFFSKGLATDPTLLFLSELAKNRIEILDIEKVTYHITFPGWKITVDEFNRSSNNSGWLISDVTKQ
jgi:hypothetical protein